MTRPVNSVSKTPLDDKKLRGFPESGFSAVPEKLKEKIMNKVQKFGRIAAVSASAVGALLLSTGANAAIDVAAATTGIADAQTAVLAVLGTMITMAAAVYGVRKVLNLIGGGR